MSEETYVAPTKAGNKSPEMTAEFKTYVRRLAKESGIKKQRLPGGRDYSPELFTFADKLVMEAMRQFEDALAASTVSKFTNLEQGNK